MTEAVAQEPTTAKYDARSIVDAAADHEPATVRNAYADLVIDRVYDLVKAKRLEVAQMFGKPPAEEPEETEDEADDAGSAET